MTYKGQVILCVCGDGACVCVGGGGGRRKGERERGGDVDTFWSEIIIYLRRVVIFF